MRERVVEERLRNRVKELGGMCLKFAPIKAGTPDRLVLLPGGRIHLVELKAPQGRLRAAQTVFMERAATLGVEVVVLSSVEEVDRWVDTMKEA